MEAVMPIPSLEVIEPKCDSRQVENQYLVQQLDRAWAAKNEIENNVMHKKVFIEDTFLNKSYAHNLWCVRDLTVSLSQLEYDIFRYGLDDLRSQKRDNLSAKLYFYSNLVKQVVQFAEVNLPVK